MNFLKRFKGLLIAAGVSVILLTIAFCLPEQNSMPTFGNSDIPILDKADESSVNKNTESAKPDNTKTKETAFHSPAPVSTPDTEEIKPPIQTPLVPLETKPTEAIIQKNTLSCTLTVRCDTILNNLEKLSPEKTQLIPENGIILTETEAEFSDGDTVFDILAKELRSHSIHFEFSKVAMSDSVYIEGIGNLYEFDCGNLSGWLYRVNGKVLSVGCSEYKIKNGDKIEWIYTCNLGKDVI